MAYIDKSGHVRSSANPSDVVRLAFPKLPRATTYYNPTSYNSNYTPKDPNDYVTNALGFLPVNTKYLSNTTNGFAMNSFADALFNKEAIKKRWDGTVLDVDNPLGWVVHNVTPLGGLINSIDVVWNTVAKPIGGSIKMALEKPNDNFNFWDGLSAGLSTAAVNSLVNIGNTLDIVANPVKGAILEGIYGDGAWTGFKRGLVGDAEYGRKQYDYSDYGFNFGESLVLEFISDPLNLITLGTKSIGSLVAKGGTSLVDDALDVVTNVFTKGVKEVTEEITPEIGEQVVKEVADDVGQTVGKEVVEAALKENAVPKTITKYVFNDGNDAVEALTKALRNKGFNSVTEDGSQKVLKYLTDAVNKGSTVSEALEQFSKGAKSSATDTLKRLLKNPEVVKKLLGTSVDRSMLREILAAPASTKLPNNIGEAMYQSLSQTKKLRGVAGKWAGFKGWTPATQNFVAETVRDITLDQLPDSLLNIYKVYRGTDWIDAYLRNIAFRGTGLSLLGKGGGKLVNKGLGYISNYKMKRLDDTVKNTTDWLLDTKPDYAIDFSKHGDVVHVRSTATPIAKASIKDVELPFKELDAALNEQRDNILKTSFLQDNLDVSGLQKIYDDELVKLNEAIASKESCKRLNITNFKELVTYLNKLETDDEVINRFIKKLNDTYKRLSKKVTKTDLEAYLKTLNGIAELAQREELKNTVADNLKDIIDNSAISKNITEERLELARMQRAEASRRNRILMNRLKRDEVNDVLTAAANLAHVDKSLYKAKTLLERTRTAYAGNDAFLQSLNEAYENYFEQVAIYRSFRQDLKAIDIKKPTAEITDKHVLKIGDAELSGVDLEVKRLQMSLDLIAAYEELYSKFNMLDFSDKSFKSFDQKFDVYADLPGGVPQYKPLIEALTRYVHNTLDSSDNLYKDFGKEVDRLYKEIYDMHFGKPKATSNTVSESVVEEAISKTPVRRTFKISKDTNKLFIDSENEPITFVKTEYNSYVPAHLEVRFDPNTKYVSPAATAQERLLRLPISPNRRIGAPDTSDVDKIKIPEGFQPKYEVKYETPAKPTKGTVADFEAYTLAKEGRSYVSEFKENFEDYAIGAVKQMYAERATHDALLDELKASVTTLPDLSGKLSDTLSIVNAVDIDSVVTNQLVGYALGLSKHGLLTSLLKGDGPFTALLDEFDIEDGVLKNFLTKNDKGLEHISATRYNKIPDRIMSSAAYTSSITGRNLDDVLENDYHYKLPKIEYTTQDSSFSNVYMLLEKLSETRKLMRAIEDILSKRLDAQHVACFMDEFISKALEKPNALSPENIVKTLEEVFDGAEQKLSAYMDVPKLTQDYLIRDLLAELTQKGTGFDTETFTKLNTRINEAHDSLADINNWIDAFVKLNSDNQKTLYELTEKGKRYIVVFDTETTGLADLPSSQVYQLSAKIIDYNGNEIAEPIKLNIKVKDMPDTPVLNKLFKSVSEEELNVLRKALDKQDITAEDWFKHTYMNNGVLAEQNAITMKQALGTLWSYMGEAQSKDGLMPILAGHNIEAFDIYVLSKKAAYSNTPLKKYFDEASLNKQVFDTYANLQTKQFWRIDTELRDSYIPQLVETIKQSKLKTPTQGYAPVFGFSDVRILSEFKSMLKDPAKYNLTLVDVFEEMYKTVPKLETYSKLYEACNRLEHVLTSFDHNEANAVEKCGKLCEDIAALREKLGHHHRKTKGEQTYIDALNELKVYNRDPLLYYELASKAGVDPKEHISKQRDIVLKYLKKTVNGANDTLNRHVATFEKQVTHPIGVRSKTTKYNLHNVADLVDFIDDAITEVTDTWNSVAKIRGANELYIFSKAGAGPEDLIKLWEQDIISIPGWRNIMSMLLHNTDANAQVMLNPHTVYSYIFENFYDKNLVKTIYGSGEENKYVSKSVLQHLTQNVRHLDRIKKGLTVSAIDYHYASAYEILSHLQSLMKEVDFAERGAYVYRKVDVPVEVPDFSDVSKDVMYKAQKMFEESQAHYMRKTRHYDRAMNTVFDAPYRSLRDIVETNFNYKVPYHTELRESTVREFFVRTPQGLADFECVNLEKLPKANVVALLISNYDAILKYFSNLDGWFFDEALTKSVIPDGLTNKLAPFKDFNSLYNAVPDFDSLYSTVPDVTLGHKLVKQYKRQNVAKLDDEGNFVNIFTHRTGSYDDILGAIENAAVTAEDRLKEMQRFNDDHHLFTALNQATASLHRRASERVERVKQFFKNATAEERELYHKQIDDIDVIYSKEHLNHFLYRDNAPQLFKNEARLSGGCKAFFSEERIDLSDFEKAGIITKVKPVTLENGVSGYMHLLGVRMKDYQDIIVLNHELTPDILKSLEVCGIVVKSEKIINNGVTTYKYIFNNATELSKDILDAKIIDDLDIAPKLKELHVETRMNDAVYIKNIGYSTGDVQTEQLFNSVHDFFGDEAKELIPVETLKSLGFFNDLKANQVVIGSRPIQAVFNPYACSDFIRRSAYSTVNYIDTQLDSVTRYLNMLCNNEDGLRTSDWLKDLTDADLYEVLKNNKDFTLVYVRPSGKWSKTASGLVVEKVHVNSVKSITLARQLNAHLVPTYSAYTMMQAVNTFKLPPMIRLIQNISTLYKVGYLSSVGWLVRNFVDSNYKNHLDFKDDVSIIKQVQDLFNTMRLVMNYTDILQGVGRTLDNTTEYKALYHLCKDSPETLAKLLNQNNSLARYIKRFQDGLSKDKLDEISKHLIDPDLFEVTDLFIKNGPSAGIARSLKNTVPTTNSTTQNFVDYWTSKGLTGMLFNTNELIEQSARLQSYLYALQHGASLDEAVARVIKTHFDYSDKSLAMLYTELVFPFMSFSFKNLEYWIDTLYSKGVIAGELENVFRCVLDYNSLFNPDYEVYRNYDYSFDFEKDVVGFRSNQPWQLINAARLYHMLNGNIVWDTGKDVKYNNGHEVKDADLLAVFKLSPSILDAVNMLYMPLDQFQQRMLPPYEVLLQSVESALSGDTTSLSETVSINGMLNNLPFVGATLQRLGINGDGSTKPNNVIKRIEDDGIWQAVSSLFTAAYVPHKKYNTWYGADNQYLTQLPQYEYAKSPYYYSRLGGFKMNYTMTRYRNSYYNPNASRYRIESLAHSPYYKSPYSKSKRSSLRTTYYSSLTYNALSDNLLKKRVLDKYRYL